MTGLVHPVCHHQGLKRCRGWSPRSPDISKVGAHRNVAADSKERIQLGFQARSLGLRREEIVRGRSPGDPGRDTKNIAAPLASYQESSQGASPHSLSPDKEHGPVEGAAFLTQACQVTKTGLGHPGQGGDSGIRSRLRSEAEKQPRVWDALSPRLPTEQSGGPDLGQVGQGWLRARLGTRSLPGGPFPDTHVNLWGRRSVFFLRKLVSWGNGSGERQHLPSFQGIYMGIASPQGIQGKMGRREENFHFSFCLPLWWPKAGTARS